MQTQFCNYTIQGELGRGGMAVVYRAVGSQGGAVALKTMLPRCADDPSIRRRFAREAELRLKHPNIVQIVDTGECNGIPYFAMQLIEGESLDSILSRMGKMTLPQALPILRDVAAGLDYAHSQNVIHRDIKPSNVLIRARDGRAVLTDFGVAKDVGAIQLTSMIGQRIGTPQYMSPEQARGDPKLTPASDVYALGILAYRALSGRVPFDAESDLAIARMHLQDPPPDMRKWNTNVSPAVAGVVMCVLSKDPAKRPRTAMEFVDALAAAQSGRVKGTSSNKIVIGIAAAIATLVIGGALALAFGRGVGSGQSTVTPMPASANNQIVNTLPAPLAPTATLIPKPTETPINTPTPTSTPTPACQQNNPFNVSGSVLQNLGCGGSQQYTRTVVVQSFAGGFMLAFAKPGDTWDDNKPGEKIIYAFSDGGRAWRVVDQLVQTSLVEDTWYSCLAPPHGQRPENSGIPWRGFGKAWCNNSAISNALGRVSSGSGEKYDIVQYADYENGSRVVHFRNRTYVIAMNSNGMGTWQ